MSSAIVLQLFATLKHLYTPGCNRLVSVLGTGVNREAMNSPAITTISVGSSVTKLCAT
jgi:hypothetical protein